MCRQAGGRPSGCAGRSVDRRPLVRGHRLKYLAYSISSAHAAECRVYFCPGNLVFPTRDSLRPEPARPAMEHSWAADRQVRGRTGLRDRLDRLPDPLGDSCLELFRA
jgi:hypothetical protein